jgi:hypothetical protein
MPYKMKSTSRQCLFVFVFVVIQSTIHAQSVSINDDASLPHPSAILDIKVSSAAKKGILVPRMTASQRTAIAAPGKGLLVYDSTSNSFWFHNGTRWTEMSKGVNPWIVNGTSVYNLGANIGIGISMPKAKLHVAKDQNVLFGESMSGLGNKLFWNSAKGAFRAGNVQGEYPNDQPPYPWDDSRVGTFSFATGSDNEASGLGSTAFGGSNQAIADWSMVGGTFSGATGRNSFAFGFSAAAAGDNSVAVGYVTNAAGKYSAAFNRLNSSYGGASFTAGADNETYGSSAATFGGSNFNTSNSSLVIGQLNDSITSQSQASAAISPLFTIGNGTSGTNRKNAFVVLRNGYTGINKNPGSVAVNDGLLQLKQSGARHLLTLEAATTSNKWSLTLTPNLVLYYNNSIRGTFNSTTGAYVAASDARLKKDLKLIEPVLQDIMQLKTYTYHLLDNEEADQLSYGLIAHELQQVFPDLVSRLDPQDTQSLLGINYSNLSVLSIKSIQELKAIIDNQNTVIERLTSEYQQMQTKVQQQEARLIQLESRINEEANTKSQRH